MVTNKDSITIDELISELLKMKEKLGGESLVYTLECNYEKNITGVYEGYYGAKVVVLE